MSTSNYYNLIFSLANHYQYGIQDLEQLYPFERDIYYGLLISHIEDKNQQIQQQEMSN